MPPFCIPRQHVSAFKKALIDGTIDPAKMIEMSADERRAFLEPYVGGADAARIVNQQFEAKILTKDIQRTMTSWAKNVMGVKPEIKQDLVSRITRLDERILNPKDEEAFLKDLAAQKLGANVTFDQVKQINDLADKVKETRNALYDDEGKLKNAARPIGGKATPEEQAYGDAANDLDGYVTALRINQYDEETLHGLNKFLFRPARLAYEFPRKILTYGHGGVIPFTHARTSFFTPGESTIFMRTVKQAYSYLRKESGEANWKKDMGALRSDPQFDFALKNGLDVGIQTAPSGMGMTRWTKESFDALKTMRLDLFKKYWNKMGADEQTPEMAKNIATTINHATGVANVPPKIAKWAERTMFAPKLRVAKYIGTFGDPFTSSLARTRLVKMVAMNVGLLAVNDMVNRYILGKTGDDTVNWTNPTQADWLRMKVAGMTVPMAPVFEMMRLPFRQAAVLLDQKETDKFKVVKSELGAAAHPTITASIGGITGKEPWSGKPLPYPGLAQILSGKDQRKPVRGEKLGWGEYGAGFAPLPIQPVLKELATHGVKLDPALAPAIVEGVLSGTAGEHTYQTIPYSQRKKR